MNNNTPEIAPPSRVGIFFGNGLRFFGWLVVAVIVGGIAGSVWATVAMMFVAAMFMAHGNEKRKKARLAEYHAARGTVNPQAAADLERRRQQNPHGWY